jgi:branched-chain amino acid transport system substrate-binding protein
MRKSDTPNRRSFLKWSGAAVTTTTLAGCSGSRENGNGNGTGEDGSDGGNGDGSNNDGGTTDGPNGSEDTIKIGYICSLSGPIANLGQTSRDAAQLAVDIINEEEDGFNGNEVELLVRDGPDPETGVQLADELINSEEVDILHCGDSSSVGLAVQEVVGREELPAFISSASSDVHTGNCNRWTYRFRDHAEMQQIAFAPWLYEQGYETAYTLVPDYAFGESQRSWFTQFFEEAGGTVVGSGKTPFGGDDFSSQISNIDTDADILFLSQNGSDAVTLINQLRDFGIKEQMEFVGTPAITSGGVLQTASEALADTVVCGWYSTTTEGEGNPLNLEGNIQFRQDFEDEYGYGPRPMSVTNWESIWGFKQAADNAGFDGRDDKEALIEALDALEMEHSYRFPQGPKRLRAEDNQIIEQEYITRVQSDGSEEYITHFGLDITEETQVACEL